MSTPVLTSQPECAGPSPVSIRHCLRYVDAAGWVHKVGGNRPPLGLTSTQDDGRWHY